MNRNGIIKHIELHIAKEGSMNALAKKIGVNAGALSTILRGKYGADESSMLSRIAAQLNYRERDWNTVRSITNYRVIRQVFDDAKKASLWFTISAKAGSGKTETLEDIYNADETGSVVFVQAGEWSARQFLEKLIEKTVGCPKDKKYRTVMQMTESVVNWFNENADLRPVLVIDEADKLKAPALRTLIPLYNGTENRLGAIFSGTENFQKEISSGVRTQKKGYDELRSRFGISSSGDGYITLKGATKQDVFAICKANGVESDERCDAIWNELEKVKKQTRVRAKSGAEKDATIDYVEDFRRLMRMIKREQMKTQTNNA